MPFYLENENYYICLTNDINFLSVEEFFHNDEVLYVGQTTYLESDLFKEVCPSSSDGYYDFSTGEYDKNLTDSFFSLVKSYDYCLVSRSND